MWETMLEEVSMALGRIVYGAAEADCGPAVCGLERSLATSRCLVNVY